MPALEYKLVYPAADYAEVMRVTRRPCGRVKQEILGVTTLIAAGHRGLTLLNTHRSSPAEMRAIADLLDKNFPDVAWRQDC